MLTIKTLCPVQCGSVLVQIVKRLFFVIIVFECELGLVNRDINTT